MWYAKPSGGYTTQSTEGIANIFEIYNILIVQGYTDESIAGLLGNVYHESALNPWRWQSDTVDQTGGYGLFQFTPASQYFSVCSGFQYYSPNMSTSSITSGATPEDGIAQVNAFANDSLVKWNPYCWRSYWSQTQYAAQYQITQELLSIYGANGQLTQSQFANIDQLTYATMAFLGCYEGPIWPDLFTRLDTADIMYQIITGEPPTPPEPPTPTRKNFPIWFMLRKF